MHPEHPVNILIVDDRAENLIALEALLAPLGHTVIKAHSGKEALKCLLQQDFAVILLDVQMPGMDGFETAELIRGRDRSEHTPIIFLTAVNTGEGHVFRGYALGAVDYLFKPIVPEILLSKVSVFVELWRKTEQVQQQADQLAASVAALREARDQLEERVKERTANLAATNEALRKEIVVRKRAERERAQLLVREQHARAEAEAAVKLRDQFLSIASHELKTPLTTLFGYAQLLKRRFERDNDAEDQSLRLITVLVEQAQRLNRLIEALLDISRIQTGQLTIARYPVDMAMVVRRVVDAVQPSLEQHTVTCSGAEEMVLVEGDELRLDQVLHNLVQNAIKYSPTGGSVSVALEQREQQVCVSVSDQGIGIPADALPRLFERFFRAGNADSRNISGMGVGLFVVKEIIDMHNGTINVASSEGVGSTFTIMLPLRTPTESHENSQPTAMANAN